MECAVEQLIEIVRNYPILYDLCHAEYKNFKKKNKIWDEIGKGMGKTGKYIINLYLMCKIYLFFFYIKIIYKVLADLKNLISRSFCIFVKI